MKCCSENVAQTVVIKAFIKHQFRAWCLSVCLDIYSVLTHWGRDKMAAVSQTTFSNAFSWMKMCEFWLKFHRSLFLRVQIAIIHHWFRQWLGADLATSPYLNQWWLDYCRMYASLGLSELRDMWMGYRGGVECVGWGGTGWGGLMWGVWSVALWLC